jgi:hypothetical protein
MAMRPYSCLCANVDHSLPAIERCFYPPVLVDSGAVECGGFES